MTRINRTRGRSLYEERASTREGRQSLAAAALAMRVLELLQAAKAAAGLSNRDLAKRLGVTEGRVSQVMNGDGNVHIASIVRYLGVCGYEVTLNAVPAEPGLPDLNQTKSRPIHRYDQPPGAWLVMVHDYLTHHDHKHDLAVYHVKTATHMDSLGPTDWHGQPAWSGRGSLGEARTWLMETESAVEAEESHGLVR